MKTKIRKITAAFLLALLCLTAVPAAAFAAETAENTGLAVDVAIPVSVELSGEAPSPAESFVLTLQALDNAPLPAEHTLTITGAGTASFPAITYTAPGIYYYTVTQQAGSHARGHYDSAVYYVRVSVTNAENGGLEAVVAAHTDAQMVSAKRDITFTNTYDPVPAATTEQPSNPATQPSDQDSSSDDNAGSDSGTTKKSSGTSAAKTGDSNNPLLWMSLLVLAGSGLAAIAGDNYRKWQSRRRG